MPRTILSIRSHTTNWQPPRRAPSRPPTTVAPSIAAPEAKSVNGVGWAALVASAHDTYRRERQMTTSERVEVELAKRHSPESVSGTTKVEPLTEKALMALNSPEDKENYAPGDDEEMVPNFSYAVAELAKNLEETRKALRRKEKEVERLNRENRQLKKNLAEREATDAQLDNYKNWVSPEKHEQLRKGWEDWADIAEKKVESLQEKLDKTLESNNELNESIETEQNTIKKLEERLIGSTSSHERKVLDATIDMLRNDLTEIKEERNSCPLCAQKASRGDFRSTLDIAKPGMGRQYSVI